MKKIISGIILVILLAGFIVLGTKEYKQKETDNVTFSNEYQEIDENNVYTYTNATKVLTTLRNGDGIIFFGFKSNVWAGYYANILNSIAMSLGVEEIYYYDFLEDRKNHNGTYESIVNILEPYLTVLDDGTKNIYSPSFVVVRNGEILAYNDDTAFNRGNITPDKYWTESKINEEKNKLYNLVSLYLIGEE